MFPYILALFVKTILFSLHGVYQYCKSTQVPLCAKVLTSGLWRCMCQHRANATIVCGHDIGQFAFIGAGAVVTKEVLAYALVVGNPTAIKAG